MSMAILAIDAVIFFGFIFRPFAPICLNARSYIANFERFVIAAYSINRSLSH